MNNLRDVKIVDVEKDPPTTMVAWATKNAYALIIVALIALIAFMFYPGMVLTIMLSIAVPILCGVSVEMFYQTDYYESLNYQLSRLEKTAILSGVVGTAALSMGYFSENVTEYLESVMTF